jgi:hypothetical protein
MTRFGQLFSHSIRLRTRDMLHNMGYREKRIQQRRHNERFSALHLNVLQNAGVTCALLGKRCLGLHARGRFRV